MKFTLVTRNTILERIEEVVNCLEQKSREKWGSEVVGSEKNVPFLFLFTLPILCSDAWISFETFFWQPFLCAPVLSPQLGCRQPSRWVHNCITARAWPARSWPATPPCPRGYCRLSSPPASPVSSPLPPQEEQTADAQMPRLSPGWL